jgi:hypothetical protein
MFDGRSLAASRCAAAEDVEREIAEAVVVAVEEPAFLMAVDRIIGGIEVEYDLLRRTAVRIEKQIDKQRLDGGGIVTDLVIARRRGLAQFEAVERALASQRRAIRPSRRQLPSGGFPPAKQVEPWPPPPANTAITGSWRSSSWSVRSS